MKKTRRIKRPLIRIPVSNRPTKTIPQGKGKGSYDRKRAGKIALVSVVGE